MGDIVLPINVEANENLAQQMKKQKVPLEYECGFNCECATCMVQFESQEVFDKVNKNQPLYTDEKIVLRSELAPVNSRLTCQIKATSDLEGATLLIPE